VVFDKRANAFNKEAAQALHHLAVPRTAGIYTQTPPPREETLFSNLLPVALYAQRIYSADTSLRAPKEVLKTLTCVHGRSQCELSVIVCTGGPARFEFPELTHAVAGLDTAIALGPP